MLLEVGVDLGTGCKAGASHKDVERLLSPNPGHKKLPHRAYSSKGGGSKMTLKERA